MNAEPQTAIVDEKLLTTLYVIYRTSTGEITRSDMTRGMINKKLTDPAERERLIQEARDQKLLAVGRKIQMGKGGQNPIIYKITKLGMDTVAPFVGDEDLADHEK